MIFDGIGAIQNLTELHTLGKPMLNYSHASGIQDKKVFTYGVTGQETPSFKFIIRVKKYCISLPYMPTPHSAIEFDLKCIEHLTTF